MKENYMTVVDIEKQIVYCTVHKVHMKTVVTVRTDQNKAPTTARSLET